MTTEAALPVVLSIALSFLMLYVNMKTREQWLRLLSLMAMLFFAALAGFSIVKAIFIS